MITVKQLDKYTGRGRWVNPNDSDFILSKSLPHLLYEYNESNDKTLIEFIERHGYKLKRLYEKPEVLVIHPKNRGQMVILYNVTTTNKIICSYPHSGQDSVDDIAYECILNGDYKCVVLNGYQPNSSNDPSPYQKGRNVSNADHSPVPSMSDFLNEFINHSEHKDYILYVLHGMSSKKTFKVWHISSTGKRTRKDLIKNICFWMCVAFTQSNKFNDLQGRTNYDFSDFYVKIGEDKKKPLTGPRNSKWCFFQQFRGPTTSVSAHIMNAGSVTEKQGRDSGRVVHCENAISTLGNRAYYVVQYHKLAYELYEKANLKNLKNEDLPNDIDEMIKFVLS